MIRGIIRTIYFSKVFNIASGCQYGYQATSGGAGMRLSVNFETPEALEAVQKSAKDATIVGKTVTFTEKNFLNSYFYFSGKPKQPALLNFVDSVDLYANYIPINLKSDATFSGTAERSMENADGHFKFSGNATFGDSTFSVDAEIMKKGENFFARLNKIPSMLSSFVDFSKIMGVWIKITPNDIVSSPYSAGFSFGQDATGTYRKTAGVISEQIKLFVQLADEEKAVIVLKGPVREKLGDVSTFRYDLGIGIG
jgi:hypothetical protein